MKNIENMKETKFFLMIICQHVDEANMKLMFIREKLQELKAHEEEQKQLISLRVQV